MLDQYNLLQAELQEAQTQRREWEMIAVRSDCAGVPADVMTLQRELGLFELRFRDRQRAFEDALWHSEQKRATVQARYEIDRRQLLQALEKLVHDTHRITDVYACIH